jgi:hypothetical protein
VWIVKHSETLGTFPANLPVCTAELVIRKPVGLETLWNLLQLPLRWQLNGTRFQIPIQGISKVRIEKEGRITGPLDSPEEYLRFSNPCYRTDMDLVEVETSPESKQTIMHLSRLMQPSKFLCTRRNDESDFSEGELAERVLDVELGQDNDVYYDLLQAVRRPYPSIQFELPLTLTLRSDQLDAILDRQVAVDVKISHQEATSLSHIDFVARMRAAIEVYTRHYPTLHDSRKAATAPDNVFVMDAPQAIQDAETEPFDDDFHWPRKVYGSIYLENNGLWVHSASGSTAQDDLDLVGPETILL